MARRPQPRAFDYVYIAPPQYKKLWKEALLLLDSQQVRLARMYSSASYRAATHMVTLPIPRTGGVGSARLRDTELVDYLVTFLQTIVPVES